MRHHVKFGRPPFRWSLRRRLHFLGKGTIHFEETGILLGGDVLKFRLPFVDLFYQKLIADHGTRTIPYSTIVRHRQVPYWPTMLVKALLLIILTASLAVIVWAFLRHGHSLGLEIAASVVVLLALGVLLLGRRYHDLTFRLPDDGRCRVHFSVRRRTESNTLRETLERYMAAAESSALPQTQSPATETVRGQTNRGGCPRCGQPLPTGLASVLPKTGDKRPPRQSTRANSAPSEESFADAGKRHSASPPPTVATTKTPPGACALCGREMKSGWWISKAFAPNWTRWRDVAAEAFSWFVMGLLAATLIYLTIESRLGKRLIRDSVVLQKATEMFVEPGEQLHGMFFPFSVFKAKTPSRTSLAERLPTIWIVSFWAIASGFLGAFASYARPPLPRRTRLNPLRRVLEAGGRWLAGRLDEPRKKVVFAVWVLIILGVVTIGWYARELIYHQANRIELGLTEDDRYAVPYSPYLPYPYTYEPQREVRDAQMDRLKELLEEGQRLDQQGKHYDAQQRYRDALSLVARIRPRIHRDVATIHQLLAHSFYLHGWHAKAAEHYRKVPPILVAIGEGDSDMSVMSHNNYARMLSELGETSLAKSHFERALEIAAQAGRQRGTGAALVHVNFARLLDEQRLHGQARLHYDQAIDALLRLPEGAAHNEKSHCLVSSAMNLLALGRWGEAWGHAAVGAEHAKYLPEIQYLLTDSAAGSVQSAVFARFYRWLVILPIALAIAWNAARRGYSTPIWLVAECASLFPMANLAVLASLPHRHRRQRRRDIHQQFRQMFGEADRVATGRQVPARSVGDETTVL